MKNVIVYYQKDFNPYAKYTINFAKTHIKVFEGVIGDDQDADTLFSVFNSDNTNPLSYTNTTNKVCFLGKDKFGTGADFQEAMKKGKNPYIAEEHHLFLGMLADTICKKVRENGIIDKNYMVVFDKVLLNDKCLLNFFL